jgi:catechol 2,3-dioxygenase-like lactoylglutathione lyase family enzyme
LKPNVKEAQMIDHIGLRTRQFDALVRFYEATLAPLGWTKLMAFESSAGFGRDGSPVLWIGAGQAPSSVHLAITSTSREAVDAFHAAALAAGGSDNGKPGLRAEYHPNYYGAFIIDLDGNNLEAVCHRA